MPEASPLISIIIPTFNRPLLLAEALKSILNQTYQQFEIIVINDGGTSVHSVIDQFNDQRIISLEHTSKKGPGAARNTGIKNAKGKYIAYLDDDDLFLPHHLETLIDNLIGFDYKVAYSDVKYTIRKKVDDNFIKIDKTNERTNHCDLEHLLIDSALPIITVVHEKRCFDQVGIFDETLYHHEDWDFWIRLIQHFHFLHIPEITAEYVITEGYSQTITSWLGFFLNTMQIIHQRYKSLTVNRPDIQQLQKIRRQQLRTNALKQLMKMDPSELKKINVETIIPKLAESALLLSPEDIEETHAMNCYLLQCLPEAKELWEVNSKLNAMLGDKKC